MAPLTYFRSRNLNPLRLTLIILFTFIGLSVVLPRISQAILHPQSSDKQNEDSKSLANRARPELVPGEILVRFREGSAALLATGKRADIFTTSFADRSGRQIQIQVKSLGENVEIVPGLRLARVLPEDTSGAIEALSARPDVLYAEPNFIRHIEAVPNDTRYPELWNMHNPGGPFAVAGADIKAEEAWNITTGSRDIVVAVIDQGVQVFHPDLTANIWRNPGETGGNGIDDDANGFIDDLNGYDFVNNDSSVYDGTGDFHGTHVAGIIGATGNNGTGVAGVNWQTSMMSLKFLGPNGGTSADLLRAFSYTKMMRDRWVSSGGTQGANIRVTNNSYGGSSYSQAEVDAIQALGTSGILFVVAAGNNADDNNLAPAYPAAYDLPNIISVAATDQSDRLAGFSNFGTRNVHVGAPGVGILSTYPTNLYSFLNGTSMASPHVAGVAALVLAQHPTFSIARLRASILFGGAPVTALSDKTETGNRLDAAGALQNALESDVTAPAATTDLHVVNIDGRTITLAWTAPGDDGSSGQASLVETRFTDQATGKKFLIGASSSAPADSQQFICVNIPYQHTSGTLELRVMDNAGNTSTNTVPVTVDQLSASPYEVTESPAEPLSTGGTPLHQSFGDRISNYDLPFTFPFFEHDVQSSFASGSTASVNVSTNGTLYMARTPTPANDAFSIAERLSGRQMIAGLWDDLDLSTSNRPDADIYVVNPDSSRIIFRWQGVGCNLNEATGQCTVGGPVNFEIEIRSDGTIITRYGSGNTNVHPVVGISGGDRDPFVVTSHTYSSAPMNLTNAPTITYRPRTTTRSADVRGIMSASPRSVLLGQNTTITIDANNAGPNTAAGVKLQGLLPTELTYVSCTTPQGACWGIPSPIGTRLYAELGSISANSSVPVRVLVNATRSPEIGQPYTTNWSISSSTYDPALPNSSTFSFNGIRPNPNPLIGAIGIGAGAEHSLAVVPGGNVVGWGHNSLAQLGDDTFPYRVGPVYVAGITNVTAVDGGAGHSIALKSDGTVWAWGGNSGGQLGDGTTTNRKTPAPVNGLANITAIAAGAAHNVALRSDGTVWTWGANAFGQLGNGTNTNSLTPVQVSGLTGVIAIAAGTEHTAVVKNDGTVWTWGGNESGQLGNGSQINSNLPVQATGLSSMTRVAAGIGHTLALRSDGTVWAWGQNGFGELGDGTSLSRLTPVQTLGLNNVAAIAAGGHHSVALRTDGTVWGWGSNSLGQLGLVDNFSDQHLPVQTLWLSGITAIAGGEDFSLALGAGGKVFAWGQGQWGQLGDGESGGGRGFALDAAAAQNLIDNAAFFVRRHYLDFFSREPDPGGYQFWTFQILNCNSDQACIELKRINVSAAFYLSIEFQQTGYLVERIYKVAYGDAIGTSTLGTPHQLPVPIVRYNEFLPDTQTIGQGVVVGQPGWEQVLETNKQNFLAAFAQRSRFTTAFPTTMTPAQFVDTLNTNAGNPLSPSERNQLVTDLSNSVKTRAQVLRAVAEDSDLNEAESNRAFVLMQYFGYLRRNPNDPPDADYTGYDFWLGKLNQFNGNFINAEMVKAFIVSGEYRQRFGQ